MNQIDIAVEAIYRRKLNLLDAYNTLRDSIKGLIEQKGGYINTANNDNKKDNIYGAVFDCYGGGELIGVYIKALKVVSGNVYCYCASISNANVIYDDEYMKADEDNWFLLDISSDLVYGYTLYFLADVFENGEYV